MSEVMSGAGGPPVIECSRRGTTMGEADTLRRIRLYCDGELGSAEAAQMERTLAADAGCSCRADFERRLRVHVGRVMSAGCPGAPPGLADRIRGDLAGPAAHGDRPAAAAAGRAGTRAWLRGPQRANALAVAATLAVVAGAILYGIFGRSIDEWGTPPDLVAEAVPFVADEHVRVAGNPGTLHAKAVLPTPRDAADDLSAYLAAPVRVEELAERLAPIGWRFVGGGHCGVPVGDHSGHLIFARQPGRGPAMLSVFMVPDRGGYQISTEQGLVPLTPGRWVRLCAERKICRDVAVYSDGHLVYFLVACYPAAMEGADRALEETAGR